MLRDRKIAVFIDVDNAMLEYKHYDNVMQQLHEMGEIVCGTVYGASERKHKKVIVDARNSGFAIQLPARDRRRVRKVFDSRILIDVTDLVCHNPAVDTIAIVSHPSDMVYFFSYLRRLGLQVVASDDLDEDSLALVSSTVDLGKVETIKLPKKSAPKKAATPKAPKPQVQPAPQEEDSTAALIKEIEELKKGYVAEEPPVEEPQPVAEEPVVEEPVAEPKIEEEPAFEDSPAEESAPVTEEPQQEPDIVEATNSLLDQIAALQHTAEEPTPAAEEPQPAPAVEEPQPVAQPEAPAPASQPEEEPQPEAPRASYISQNDSDLIRKIEELHKDNSAGNDADDLVSEIQKLLAGLE